MNGIAARAFKARLGRESQVSLDFARGASPAAVLGESEQLSYRARVVRTDTISLQIAPALVLRRRHRRWGWLVAFMVAHLIHASSAGVDGASIPDPPTQTFVTTGLQDLDRNQDPELFERMFGNELATRPVPQSGPTTILYGVEIEEIRTIEAAQRRYYVRGFLWTYWNEPRARFPPHVLAALEGDRRESPSVKWGAGEIRDRKLVWDPELDFVNADRDLEVNSETIEVFPLGFEADSGAHVEYWCRFSGWFSDQDNRLDFHEFPFDRQELVVDISSGYAADQVVFRRCEELTEDDIERLAERLVHPEWSFESVDIGAVEVSYVSEDNRRFSTGRTVIVAARKPGFYLMNLGLPILIILGLFNCLIWIGRSEFEAKLGGIITCLLSLVAFSLVVNAEVPKIPYMTLFGKTLLACFAVITLGAACTVLHQIFAANPMIVRRTPLGRLASSIEVVIARWGAIALNICSILIVIQFIVRLLW